ncbi:MAG: hypothetical protein GX219_04670 [Tissierellia bacterium]|nr:hypothetical protein [Tissierellia bacterium]
MLKQVPVPFNEKKTLAIVEKKTGKVIGAIGIEKYKPLSYRKIGLSKLLSKLRRK